MSIYREEKEIPQIITIDSLVYRLMEYCSLSCTIRSFQRFIGHVHDGILSWTWSGEYLHEAVYRTLNFVVVYNIFNSAYKYKENYFTRVCQLSSLTFPKLYLQHQLVPSIDICITMPILLQCMTHHVTSL